MCTVSFSPNRSGFVLAMNRDEQRSRASGLPPRRVQRGMLETVFPSEPSGGTWIGVSGWGNCLALINWYSVATRVKADPISRGVLIPGSLSSLTPEETEQRIRTQPLNRINPFRLIGIFPGEQRVREWCWDLEALRTRIHPWALEVWISSGWDEAGAQASRGNHFRQSLSQLGAGRLDWLRQFHRSHDPEPGPYSTCMHRKDASTVSYTEVEVSETRVQMRYQLGSPCCPALRSEEAMERKFVEWPG